MASYLAHVRAQCKSNPLPVNRACVHSALREIYCSVALLPHRDAVAAAAQRFASPWSQAAPHRLGSLFLLVCLTHLQGICLQRLLVQSSYSRPPGRAKYPRVSHDRCRLLSSFSSGTSAMVASPSVLHPHHRTHDNDSPSV